MVWRKMACPATNWQTLQQIDPELSVNKMVKVLKTKLRAQENYFGSEKEYYWLNFD